MAALSRLNRKDDADAAARRVNQLARETRWTGKRAQAVDGAGEAEQVRSPMGAASRTRVGTAYASASMEGNTVKPIRSLPICSLDGDKLTGGMLEFTARNDYSAIVAQQHRMLVDRDGRRVGEIKEVDPSVSVALEASRLHQELTRTARHVVGPTTQHLERIWTKDATLPRSGTCMRRTTLRNNNCAAAANFLGIPLTNTVGNITLRGDESDCLQPDDVAVWLENSVIGKVGALDHSRWKLSISAEPLNYDDNADPELVDMVVMCVMLSQGSTRNLYCLWI